MTEHDHQSLLMVWASHRIGIYPELKLLYATPNGGKRHIGVAKKLKKEGVRAGVPDLFLPCAKKGYHGFFIEMKAEKGIVSEAQKNWIRLLSEQGFKVDVCYGWEAAKDALIEYLS